MIIVAIAGGLGNQLFQLATAFALRSEFGDKYEIKLDLSFFSEQQRLIPHLWFKLHRIPSRRYCFEGCSGFSIATPLELQVAINAENALSRMSEIGFGGWYGTRVVPGRGVVTERNIDNLAGIMAKNGAAYLRGYWQGARFFERSGAEIRQALRLLCRRAAIVSDLWLTQQDVVAIHVRRTDQTSLLARRIYYRIENPYYKSALTLALEGACRDVVVCSDAREGEDDLRGLVTHPWRWCSKPAGGAFNEFEAMCRARTLVIANSTFSWWAGFLGVHDKIIAPDAWFRSAVRKMYYPREWQVVSAA